MNTTMKLIFLAALLSCSALIGLQQTYADTGAYHPAGAISTPKVEARWNYFRDHAQIGELLHRLADEFPDLAQVESIGRSYQGRELWLITVTNQRNKPEIEKTGFYIDGNIHGNEIEGADVALYTAWYLCEMYEQNEFIRSLVDDRVFYILPTINPDSREVHFHQPSDSGSPRTGQVPVDDDHDGLYDEDGPDDLDGDGNICQMRKRDPNGRWKEHEDYPGLLVRCEIDEPGQFIRLWDEGIDNDGDGMINEDGDGYYDPNRDWAWQWQPRHIQRGAYRYPFSIPENRCAADFIMAHPNIAGGQSYHNSGGMFLSGPGVPGDDYPREDVELYEMIGARGEEMIPGYNYMVTSEDLYTVHGSTKDFLYKMHGALSYTTELWTTYNMYNSDTDDWFGDREEMMKFDEQLLFGGGMVPWHEYEHPFYGTIEIGGRVKSFGRIPPSFLLEEECHRNMAFTLYHADQMPIVKVDRIEILDLEGGIRQITATIINERPLPTHLAVDLRHKLTRPDHVTLEGYGFTVLAGMQAHSSDPFFITPWEQVQSPRVMKVENIDGMGVAYVRWLVKGGMPDGVSVSSVKGGYDRRQIH